MSDRGLITPVQRVRPPGGHGALAVGLSIVVVLGLLVWRPWAAEPPDSPGPVGPRPAVVASSIPGGPDASAIAGPPDDSSDPDLFGRLTFGPWSGRVTGEWSIVAFLRDGPVPGDPLILRQQQIALMFSQPESVGLSAAICDQEGTFLHRAAADLPTREVRYLGLAYPPEESVAVRRITRNGQVVTAQPVQLGRIPGVWPTGGPPPSGSSPDPGASTAEADAARGAGGPLAAGGTVPSPVASPSVGAGVGPQPSAGASGAPVHEPVWIFALPGGGPWPDGVYRFDVSTHEGLPTAVFACIRP